MKRNSLSAAAISARSRRLTVFSREEKMVDGLGAVAIGFGVLAALWIIVFYGSSYFGPKTD